MKVSGVWATLKNRAYREEVYSTADYWDSKAAEFDDKSASMWPNNHLNSYYHQEQIAWLTSRLSNVVGKKILDVGCGTGRLSRYYAERGATVVGMDFSAKAIEIAKRESTGENPSYRVESVFDLDENHAFDIAIAWGVCTVACKNHEELLNVMIRLHKSLKPRGKMLLMEPIHKGFLHRVLNMNIQEFSEVMGEAAFKIEQITDLHFWPMRLALAYVPWPHLVTAAGYHLGQWFMGLLGNKALGDYKAICASA